MPKHRTHLNLDDKPKAQDNYSLHSTRTLRYTSTLMAHSQIGKTPDSSCVSKELPLIDSHIHLYAQTHLPRLNWTADLPTDHILLQQSSIDQYNQATNQPNSLLGFVYVETDRKSSDDESGWKDSLEEVEFLVRIAKGHPVNGEGHNPEDNRSLLGIVAWAPLPAGPVQLERYVTKVESICGDLEVFSLIKGFRYLLQDKPRGTMLEHDFIASLKWLGEHHFTFDLGIDLRQGGTWQLEEACDMISRVCSDGTSLKIVINHFCKPNLRLTADETVVDLDFVKWSQCMRTFGSYSHIYMKLSGFFSELPPQDEGEPCPIGQMVDRIRPWFDVVLSAFGPSRIMFGSDWPVCSAGGPGLRSWSHWRQLVTALLEDRKLTLDEKRYVWSGTAVQAYNIKLP